MVLATSIISTSATSSLLSEVTKDLASDQNSLRIKKLLLFACTQNWETNLHRLEQIDFVDLVRSLLAIAPTLEQLQFHIHAIASSLNKSAEYALVANTIINRVSRLYLDCPITVARQEDYEAVAQTLECDPDPLRIKKLLILASRNVWETNADRLNELTFLNLVQEVHSLTPTCESLKAVLDNLTKTLSKQAEYGAIADRICLIFESLYWLKLPAAQSHEPLEMTLTEGMEEAIPAMGEAIVHPVQSTQPVSEYAYIRQQALPDLFDLRLEIIQIANPLRVKILLFSLMHEAFTSSAEHDSLLKNHELDDLLHILLQTHKLLHELEARLLSAAKSLQEPDEYIQVAQVILRSFKPFYPYLPLKPIAISEPQDDNATNIISIEADLPEITEPDPLKGDRSSSPQNLSPQNLSLPHELTCQLLPSYLRKEANL